jgi:aspartate ammonia-lyase
MTPAGPWRLERDSLGSVEVPQDALYGAHTVRAMENFNVSGVTLPDMPEFLDAYVQVKIAATRANAELGVVPEVTADAILEACREILAGDFRDQFPVPLVQGGGGTAANMNVNEVLANRAEVLLGGTPGVYRRATRMTTSTALSPRMTPTRRRSKSRRSESVGRRSAALRTSRTR